MYFVIEVMECIIFLGIENEMHPVIMISYLQYV